MPSFKERVLAAGYFPLVLPAVNCNLSPSVDNPVGKKVPDRDVADILVDFGEARVAREKADRQLEAILVKLGLGGSS